MSAIKAEWMESSRQGETCNTAALGVDKNGGGRQERPVSGPGVKPVK
jgi:hypothetical protein